MKRITSKAFNEQINFAMPKLGSMNHTPYSSSPSNSSCDSCRCVRRNQWDFLVKLIGACVWGCGIGDCEHGPSKPETTVYHVIWVSRRRIKKIFVRLIPIEDSGGLRRRHCVSLHCGLQQKSRKNWRAHPKQQQCWKGTENEQHLWRVDVVHHLLQSCREAADAHWD